MKHPAETDLALYAGGELPWWNRLLTGLHVRSCGQCRREVEIFKNGTGFMADAAREIPDYVDWDALAGEMKANIQVGLQAAECVSPPAAAPRRIGWRMAAAVASIAVVMVSGWWLHMPHPGSSSGLADGSVAAATNEGVELREEGRTLTLLHESSEPVLVTASVDGTMSAHYVDDETGMVTINNVYVQ